MNTTKHTPITKSQVITSDILSVVEEFESSEKTALIVDLLNVLSEEQLSAIAYQQDIVSIT